MKPGDLVESATKAVGIKPCGGCQKSKELMNSGHVLRGAAMIPGNVVGLVKGKIAPKSYKVGEPASINVSGDIVFGEVPGLTLNDMMLEGVPIQPGTFTLQLKNGTILFEKTVTVE